MNTTIALVGPWCMGKSTLWKFLREKFARRCTENLVFPEPDLQAQREILKKRNEALEGHATVYEFLAMKIQESAKSALSAYQNLEAREFLVLEQSVEYLDLVVTAAKNIKIISKKQWQLLRTMVDELSPTFISDVFVLIENDDFEKCGNAHRKSGRYEHRDGAVLSEWNLEMSKMHLAWKHKQKARGKVVIEVNARTSMFTRMLKAKQIFNVVFRFANNQHGTAFQLWKTAGSASNTGDSKQTGVSRQSLKEELGSLNHLTKMPPKKTPSSQSGTALPGMTAEKLHEETVAFQMQIQRMIELQGQGQQMQGTSAGLPIPRPRSLSRPPGPRMVGPRVMLPRSGSVGPRSQIRREQPPLVRSGMMRGIRQEMRPRLPPPQGLSRREKEKQELLRRVAEIEREEKYERSRAQSAPRERQYHQGEEDKMRRGMYTSEERGITLTRAEQERMSDRSLRKQMEEATARMLAKTYGGGLEEEPEIFPSTSRKSEEVSEDDPVSSDHSDDSSDTEERKRKLRIKNKKRDAKRRRKSDRDLSPSPQQYNFGPYGYYQEEDVAQGFEYGQGQEGSATEQMYWPTSNYYEEGSQDWSGGRGAALGQDWEETPEYYYNEGNQPTYDENQGYENEDPGLYEGAGGDESKEEGQLDDSTLDSEVSRGEERDDTSGEHEVTLHDEEFQEVRKKKGRQGIVEPKNKSATGKGKSSSVGERSKKKDDSRSEEEVEEEPPKKRTSRGKKSLTEVDIFPPPEVPVRRASRKKIVKVSPTGGNPEGQETGKREITKEEVENAIANIKKEQITPPKQLTNTMRTDQLKSYLVEHVEDEISMEMNVAGDKHFPKILEQPAGNLTDLLPKLHEKVYKDQEEKNKKKGPPGPANPPPAEEVSKQPSETEDVNQSAVSLSQEEFEDLEEWEGADENAQMKKVLLESKRMAQTEEERRKAAWAALGHTAPGPSRHVSNPGGIEKKESSLEKKKGKGAGQGGKSVSFKEREEKEEKKDSENETVVDKSKEKGTRVESASKPRRSSLSGWEVRKGKTTTVPKPKPDDSKGKKATKQAPGKIQPKKKEKEDEEEKDEVGEDKE